VPEPPTHASRVAARLASEAEKTTAEA
jgi:hypothetical protein